MFSFPRGWHLVPVRLAVGFGFLSYGLASGVAGQINVVYIAALLAVCTRDPTALSLDGWLARRRLAAAPSRRR
jgi:hypothetical protein